MYKYALHGLCELPRVSVHVTPGSWILNLAVARPAPAPDLSRLTTPLIIYNTRLNIYNQPFMNMYAYIWYSGKVIIP